MSTTLHRLLITLGPSLLLTVALAACGVDRVLPTPEADAGVDASVDGGGSLDGGPAPDIGTVDAAYIKASNAEAADYFGWSVSFSADGTRLAVGARYEASTATGVNGDQADNGAVESGAVYVFLRTGGVWAQEAYIKASNSGASDWFGEAVSLSADGTRLAVSAPQENSSATGVNGTEADEGLPASGAAYVFSRSGTAWTQEAYIKPSNTGLFDRFGLALSLSADGTRLAVGAPWEASSAVGINGNQADNSAEYSGATYVFARSGTTWAQEAYLKASNTDGLDQFGYAMSMSADETRLVVGAPWEGSAATGINGDQADDTAPKSGALYVFSRTGATWTQDAYIKASNAETFDQLGWSVSLSADGTLVASGAINESSSATGVDGDQADNSGGLSGAVYLFSRLGSTWAQDAYIKASNTEGADYFGHALSLSADGTHLAVGAPFEDSRASGLDGSQTDNGSDSGAVYLFSRTGPTWAQDVYVKAPNAGWSAFFGWCVALPADGTRLAVGSPKESSGATGIGGRRDDHSAAESGAAFVY